MMGICTKQNKFVKFSGQSMSLNFRNSVRNEYVHMFLNNHLPEDFLQYYVEQLTNETSNNAMPKKWDHYKMMQRVYSNFVYLGSLLLETQATSRRDVLTYFMFITNRQV